MKKVRQFLRKYPLSATCLIAIWYLSLFFIPFKSPLNDVDFIDKWTHFVMYGGTCSVIWWEYLRSHTVFTPRKVFVWAWLAPALMSGVLELLQEYCTTNRAGEWLDLAANTFGCTIGALIGILMKILVFKK